MATHDTAQPLKLSRPHDSYQHIVADPDKNFVLIMKDSKIYKNEL